MIWFHFIKINAAGALVLSLNGLCPRFDSERKFKLLSLVLKVLANLPPPCSSLLPLAPTAGAAFFAELHVGTLGSSCALLLAPLCANLYPPLLVLWAQVSPCLLPEASLTKMSLSGIGLEGRALLS